MKYLGSKNRIAKEILPIILKDRKIGQWYVEPFVGGANMIDKVIGNRIGADNNEYLIEMWKHLQLYGYPPYHITKEQYHEIRDDLKNSNYHLQHHAKWLIGYVGFNLSYSGKWFGGYADKVFTKENIVRDYQLEARNNIIKQIKNLNNVNFIFSEYDKLTIPKESIIYCDPPYKNTTGYKDKFDNGKFWKWAEKIAEQGHKIFVSEYVAPEKWNCVWEKTVKSSLSANGKIGGNKESVEKLFTL